MVRIVKFIMRTNLPAWGGRSASLSPLRPGGDHRLRHLRLCCQPWHDVPLYEEPESVAGRDTRLSMLAISVARILRTCNINSRKSYGRMRSTRFSDSSKRCLSNEAIETYSTHSEVGQMIEPQRQRRVPSWMFLFFNVCPS